MFRAEDFILHNPPSLEDLCFRVTYQSALNDLDFTFELERKRKLPRFGHSVILPSICKTVSPDHVIRIIKERFQQLEGTVAIDFRQKFLQMALADRSFDNIEEEALFDLCLEPSFDKFELHIPVDVDAQVRYRILNKLKLMPELKELSLKVGRDFDDTSDARRCEMRQNGCMCPICLSVHRCLRIAYKCTLLTVFKLVGVGTGFGRDPDEIFSAFGECQFLETFHLLDVKVPCASFYRMIRRFENKDGSAPVSLDVLTLDMTACSKSLRDLKIHGLDFSFVESWSLNSTCLLSIPNLESFELTLQTWSWEATITPDVICRLHEKRDFRLRKAVIEYEDLRWMTDFKEYFPRVDEIVINMSSQEVETNSVELPQVTSVMLRSVDRPASTNLTSVLTNITKLVTDFVFPDFQVLDRWEKLQRLELSIPDCQNDERSTVQFGFTPTRTYSLTHFLCGGICLGPDVAREIVKNSPHLTHLDLQCIHGVDLHPSDFMKSRSLTEFRIASYDNRFSADVYIKFVSYYQFIKKVAFPSLIVETRFQAIPKLRTLHQICTKEDVELSFVSWSCNRFWEPRRKRGWSHIYTDSDESDASQEDRSQSEGLEDEIGGTGNENSESEDQGDWFNGLSQ